MIVWNLIKPYFILEIKSAQHIYLPTLTPLLRRRYSENLDSSLSLLLSRCDVVFPSLLHHYTIISHCTSGTHSTNVLPICQVCNPLVCNSLLKQLLCPPQCPCHICYFHRQISLEDPTVLPCWKLRIFDPGWQHHPHRAWRIRSSRLCIGGRERFQLRGEPANTTDDEVDKCWDWIQQNHDNGAMNEW